MEPEEKSLLLRTASLAEENNKILRKMQRAARFAKLMHALYWLLIIGAGVAAYILIQPYIMQFSELYDGARASLDEIKR